MQFHESICTVAFQCPQMDIFSMCGNFFQFFHIKFSFQVPCNQKRGGKHGHGRECSSSRHKFLQMISVEGFVRQKTDIKCVVIDEAHKALGNHAYCQVRQKLFLLYTDMNYLSSFISTPERRSQILLGWLQSVTDNTIHHISLLSFTTMVLRLFHAVSWLSFTTLFTF